MSPILSIKLKQVMILLMETQHNRPVLFKTTLPVH